MFIDVYFYSLVSLFIVIEFILNFNDMIAIITSLR